LLRDFAGAKADDDESVVATFAPQRARDVPLFVAGLPIFSRAYYTAKPFDQSTLDVPLGSGAYKVGRFEPGRYIEYERVKDWWGADLPVARGQNNFDIVRFEYYRDRDVGFEGFTAGSYLFREEFTSRTWATRYDFPASRTAASKRTSFPTIRRRARRAGSSTRGAQNSPIRGCAKRSATPSISNGPTKRSCTAPMSAPRRCFRIRT
jgi:microcin C transport system substrate-binding protein